MVVIQVNKTYFMSSRLHLPHGVREEEPTDSLPNKLRKYE